VVGDFILQVQNLPHLIKIIRALRGIKGVVNVERLDQLGDEELLVEKEATYAWKDKISSK
jgi:hypothetical protein